MMNTYMLNSGLLSNNNTNDLSNNINKYPNSINTIFDLVNHLEKMNPTISKTKLEYVSSGSNGVILKDKINDELVYKISLLSDNTEFMFPNYVEMIYLNYFKINYPNYIEQDYFPVQNVLTQVTTFEEFKNEYELGPVVLSKLKYNFIERDDDIIIINLMKKYDYDLNNLIQNTDKSDLENYFYPLIKMIIKSLNFIHLNQSSHGDFKSNNILISGSQCKISDFGGIKLLGSKIYEKTCTITSRSPEELSYEQSTIKNYFPNYGFKSELWSLGIVILELFAGYNPILKIYNSYRLMTKGRDENEIEKQLEKKLAETFSGKAYLEIKEKDQIEKSNLDRVNIKKTIEKILTIDPVLRLNNLSQVYYELFKEQLENPFKTVKFEPALTVDNDILSSFNNFRKKNYNLIFELMIQFKNINCLPLTISILDRYILRLLNYSDQNMIDFIKESNINLTDKLILFTSTCIISISLINRRCIYYKELVEKLNCLGIVENKITAEDICLIKNLIVDITEILEYDVIVDEYMLNDSYDTQKISEIYKNLLDKNF